MGYEITSQMQGPQIDVSLFPKARLMGAETGNQTKTPLQAIGEGISQGVQNYQQVQLNQAKVEAIPQETQIRQQEADNSKLENQIKLLQLSNEQLTAAQGAKAKLAELQNKADILDGQNQVAEVLANPSGSGLMQVLTHPNVFKAVMADSDLGDSLYATAKKYQDLPGGPTASNVDNLGSRLVGKRQLDADEADTEKDRKMHDALANQFDTNYAKASENSSIRSLLANRPGSDAFSQITMSPAGEKKVGTDGKYTGTSVVDPEFGITKPKQYEVFEGDHLHPQVRTVDEATYHQWTALVDSYNRTKGVGLQAGTKHVDPNAEISGTPGTPGRATPPSASTPPPEPVSTIQGNNKIVSQSVEELDKIPPPQGVSKDAMHQRMQEKAAQIQGKFKATPAATPNATPSPTASPASVSIPATQATASEPLKVNYNPTPNASLSESVGQNVELNTGTYYVPKKETWTSINTSPLTKGESALIKGMVTVESKGDINAVSPTGVRGILQVTKSTAAGIKPEDLAAEKSLTDAATAAGTSDWGKVKAQMQETMSPAAYNQAVTYAEKYGLNRDIPQENLAAGKKYITDLLTQFNGNMRLALTAYNAGPGAVMDAVKAAGSTDWNKVRAALQESLTPKKFAEANDYADRVLSASTHYIDPNNPADQIFMDKLATNGLLKNRPPIG